MSYLLEPAAWGMLVLGILVGWLLEWLFVQLFVPDPKRKWDAELAGCRKEMAALQQRNRELQAELQAAQASLAVPVPPATVAEPEPPVAQQPAPMVAEQGEVSNEKPPAPTATDDVVASAAAEEEVPPAETPAQPPEAATGDDLTRLSGIGPKLAEAMAAVGITQYSQLAAMSLAELNERLAGSGIRYSKATAETWAEQAKFAAAGNWEGLKGYQASLKG